MPIIITEMPLEQDNLILRALTPNVPENIVVELTDGNAGCVVATVSSRRPLSQYTEVDLCLVGDEVMIRTPDYSTGEMTNVKFTAASWWETIAQRLFYQL